MILYLKYNNYLLLKTLYRLKTWKNRIKAQLIFNMLDNELLVTFVFKFKIKLISHVKLTDK